SCGTSPLNGGLGVPLGPPLPPGLQAATSINPTSVTDMKSLLINPSLIGLLASFACCPKPILAHPRCQIKTFSVTRVDWHGTLFKGLGLSVDYGSGAAGNRLCSAEWVGRARGG